MTKLSRELKDVSKLMHSSDFDDLMEEFPVTAKTANDDQSDPFLLAAAPRFEKSA